MRDFRAFGVLPELGGLHDQPAGLLHRMRYAEYVWRVFDGFRPGRNWTQFAAATPGALTFKGEIDKLRAEAL